MNYTRGEWKVDGDGEYVCIDNKRDGFGIICKLSFKLDRNEELADAHLIAAAPDMYKALQNAILAMASMYRLQEYSKTEIDHELIPFKQALAKAEGKPAGTCPEGK